MKRLMKIPVSLPVFVILFLAACAGAPEPPPAEVAANSRANGWLDEMEAGRWERSELPPVTWEDVPTLLTNAQDRTALRRFPTNPLSSFVQERCLRGMMALWLIESLRAERLGGYPSLNPMIFAGSADGEDWLEASERNLEPAARAYGDWWAEVRDQPSATRAIRYATRACTGTERLDAVLSERGLPVCAEAARAVLPGTGFSGSGVSGYRTRTRPPGRPSLPRSSGSTRSSD